MAESFTPTLASLLMQAGGLGAQVIGQGKAEKEAEKQARKNAQSAAWTNLVSVAGGRGPVSVPQTNFKKTSDLAKIGQLASGLGTLGMQGAQAFQAQEDRTTKRQQAAVAQAAQLAQIGVNPDLENVPKPLRAGLKQVAVDVNAKNKLGRQKILADIKANTEMTPAQKASMTFRLASNGVNPNQPLKDSFTDLYDIASKNESLTDAGNGMYVGKDPRYKAISSQVNRLRDIKETSGYLTLAKVGALNMSEVPENTPGRKGLSSLNTMARDQLKADVALAKSKAEKDLSVDNISEWKMSDLLSASKGMTRMIRGGKVDDVTALLMWREGKAAGKTESLTQVRSRLSKGLDLPEAEAKRITLIMNRVNEELARRSNSSADPLGIR